MKLTNDEMTKAILQAAPELSVKRKAMTALEAEVKTLQERIEGYTARMDELRTETERIKAEIVKAVAAGQDPGPIQKKARKVREDLADLEVLQEASEDVLEGKEAALQEVRQELEGLLAQGVIRAKGEVEAALQERCGEIEAVLKAWPECVWEVSRQVGCNPPVGRTGLTIGGRSDLRHSLGL